ncbi:uncharacterized protein BDV14DRAFT_208971 [Aspergillus stella-maris]|uniref:uncharacterized protein n=1 Tax=Aspergillus stella-maris TaxID=1810926 RepID=UPI003CCDF425
MYLLLALLLPIFLLTISLLHHYTLTTHRKKYTHLLSNPYTMTLSESHSILLTLLTKSYPLSFALSGQIALIKSYSIASGTNLLVSTRRLSTKSGVGKRVEDTAIFFSEILSSGVDSERGLKTLAKLNWIHAQYGNRIGNEEMIHTLALNVLGPICWINRFETRPLLEFERVAVFVYWREVGMRMGIRSLPRTLDELVLWAADFEKREMVYSENNVKCLDATMDLYMRSLPSFMRGFGRAIIASLLEKDVRAALGLSDPPSWVSTLVNGILYTRSYINATLLPPRLSPLSVTSNPDPVTGRIRRSKWAFEPWYVSESTWTSLLRKVLGLNLFMGRPVPGVEWESQGYLPEELGPKEFRGRSRGDVLLHAEKMGEYARLGGGAVLGCPFALGR